MHLNKETVIHFRALFLTPVVLACIPIMSAVGAPEVPTYAQCARTSIPALVTPECVSKDDERAPAIHCTNIAVAGRVRYSTWFGGSYEGSKDTKIWSVLFSSL